jgi:hypothetical protein
MDQLSFEAIDEIGRGLEREELARRDSFQPRREAVFAAGGMQIRVTCMKSADEGCHFVASVKLPAPRGAAVGQELTAGLSGGITCASTAVRVLGVHIRAAARATASAADYIEGLS